MIQWLNSSITETRRRIPAQPQLSGGFYQGYDGGPSGHVRFHDDKLLTSFLMTIDPTELPVSHRGPITQQARAAVNLINDEASISEFNNGFFALYGVGNLNNSNLTGGASDLMSAFTQIYEGLDSESVHVVLPSQFLDLQRQAREMVPRNT